MKICCAKSSDIQNIMKIENLAFISQIQESKKTFDERLKIFSNGFFVLVDDSEDSVFENDKSKIVGYFSSEIWQNLPESNEIFTLGHKIENTHNKNGTVLYISSFAILPSFQGKHLSEFFLTSCLDSICKTFTQIKKIALLVSEDWIGAHHLYEKIGFKEVRKISGFFPSKKQDFATGIVMIKNLVK